MLQHINRIRHERGNDYVHEIEEIESCTHGVARRRLPRSRPRRWGQRHDDHAKRGKHCN
jgi:hypothetical protein